MPITQVPATGRDAHTWMPQKSRPLKPPLRCLSNCRSLTLKEKLPSSPLSLGSKVYTARVAGGSDDNMPSVPTNATTLIGNLYTYIVLYTYVYDMDAEQDSVASAGFAKNELPSV